MISYLVKFLRILLCWLYHLTWLVRTIVIYVLIFPFYLCFNLLATFYYMCVVARHLIPTIIYAHSYDYTIKIPSLLFLPIFACLYPILLTFIFLLTYTVTILNATHTVWSASLYTTIEIERWKSLLYLKYYWSALVADFKTFEWESHTQERIQSAKLKAIDIKPGELPLHIPPYWLLLGPILIACNLVILGPLWSLMMIIRFPLYLTYLIRRSIWQTQHIPSQSTCYHMCICFLPIWYLVTFPLWVVQALLIQICPFLWICFVNTPFVAYHLDIITSIKYLICCVYEFDRHLSVHLRDPSRSQTFTKRDIPDDLRTWMDGIIALFRACGCPGLTIVRECDAAPLQVHPPPTPLVCWDEDGMERAMGITSPTIPNISVPLYYRRCDTQLFSFIAHALARRSLLFHPFTPQVIQMYVMDTERLPCVDHADMDHILEVHM